LLKQLEILESIWSWYEQHAHWTVFFRLKLSKIWAVVYSKPIHRSNGTAPYTDPINFFVCWQSTMLLSTRTYHYLKNIILLSVFWLVVGLKSYCHQYTSWFLIWTMAINRWIQQPISPCILPLWTQIRLIVVFHVSIWWFVVGFGSCCLENWLLSSIIWWIMWSNNQPVTLKANTSSCSICIDTFLVDCCLMINNLIFSQLFLYLLCWKNFVIIDLMVDCEIKKCCCCCCCCCCPTMALGGTLRTI
jgi:hypothetical protein